MAFLNFEEDLSVKGLRATNHDLTVLQSQGKSGHTADWFNRQQPISLHGYDNEVSSALQHIYNPIETLDGRQPEAKSSYQNHVSTQERLYQSPYQAPYNQIENARSIDLGSERHDESKTLAQTADISETSDSQRMGSTVSKLSGQSSSTSFGFPPIKQEVEEVEIPMIPKEPISPVSSISSQLSPAKTTTPFELEPPSKPINQKPRRQPSRVKRLRFIDLRPRTSIPTNLSSRDLAQQSIHAAYSSRLSPFSLHPDEYGLLRDHICQLHVSAYLNIRNRILRLWIRNPLVIVTAEEAAGCALSSRWLGLAGLAYQFLIRKGYINFGCVEVSNMPTTKARKNKAKLAKRKTIIVIGAGMAGLGCARQLEGLFSFYQDKWTSVGDEPPKVIVLEGRSRIGGRVYSHPLKSQGKSRLPTHLRCTAEMGAHIITGFDHGNPLNIIIRGQLALHYYPLKDNSTLFDLDGHVVDKVRDTMVEKLYNDILDRASIYRHRPVARKTVDGDKELIEAGRDPPVEVEAPISATEMKSKNEITEIDEFGLEPVPGGVDKLTGKAHMVAGSRKKVSPASAAGAMGWQLASNMMAHRDLNLDAVAKSSQHPTLGAAMDEAVKQYQFLLDLSPQDLRLLNWHYANLEYANAANVSKLSLGGWDQDIGNEFEGEHAQVIGGYQQVPRGIWQYPTKLDVRTYKAVSEIVYNPGDSQNTTVEVVCDDGDVLEADRVVLTAPLGVLKEQSIRFEPELPEWKLGAIQRLGYGTLNKIILVFDQPFWNVDQDMFGLLRQAEVEDSLDQEDYVSNRGKFYLFWNCIKTSGLPVLIALMAGDAAYEAENVSDAELVSGVTNELARMFKQDPIPIPLETIVTRWGRDRFARGTYSYVGLASQPGDYEAMARPLGNLHFAGEATCGTHPATVHGAYISGLRAASEVIEALIGPIEIPNPLVTAPTKLDGAIEQINLRPEVDGQVNNETPRAKEARLEAFESEILTAIFNELGYRPSKPGKPGSNPFLLFTKDKWGFCKEACDRARRQTTGNSNIRATKNEIRAALGLMWREASEDVKRPYIEQTNNNRIVNIESAATFKDRLAAWDARAMDVRRKYVREHPGIISAEEEEQMWQALGENELGEDNRREKKLSGYGEDSGSEGNV